MKMSTLLVLMVTSLACAPGFTKTLNNSDKKCENTGATNYSGGVYKIPTIPNTRLVINCYKAYSSGNVVVAGYNDTELSYSGAADAAADGSIRIALGEPHQRRLEIFSYRLGSSIAQCDEVSVCYVNGRQRLKK